MQSPDWNNKNCAEIARLFPHCATETAEGVKIDFDLLRQELSNDIIEGTKERYRLEWPGKKEAIVMANLRTNKTLRPIRNESVDFDKTENIYIEGDNLDVLKVIEDSYLNKVKMIYIDPPYNTGKDFIYRDKFKREKGQELIDSGQVDELGQKLAVNPDTSGTYHSDWLTMMYPRLKKANNLLDDNGVIFISIDDHEVHNLRKICDEIFGVNSFVAQLVWERGRKNDAKLFSVGHEYILVYVKNQDVNLKWREEKPGAKEILDEFSRLKKIHKDNFSKIESGIKEFYSALQKSDASHPSLKHKRYNRVDKNGIWRDDNISWPSPNGPRYNVIHPTTKKPCKVPDTGWRFATVEKFELYIKNGFIEFRKDHTEPPILKRYLNYVSTDFDKESKRQNAKSDGDTESNVQVMPSVFYKGAQPVVTKLRNLMGGDYFPNPKDPDLLSRWISYVTDDGDIILDFFSGSATTAQAVLEVNALAKTKRRFVCVQLPEEIDPKEDAYKAGYRTICDIGKERIRRAAKKIKEETGAEVDYGFRVYRLDSSNMQDVYYRPQELTQGQLSAFADNVKPDRGAEDLLTQVLLDWGLPLSLPIERAEIAGKEVWKVAGNSLHACFDAGIDEAFARAVAVEKPMRIVFKDAGFASDTAKINVAQLLKQLSPATDVKVF
ncbi:MAG: site-specific DNA-methyltransferase [Chitinophagaceae bacterium]|nr:MAG: site-specific DNA-methyltransferase [Chitinophagaceae bacterium]